MLDRNCATSPNGISSRMAAPQRLLCAIDYRHQPACLHLPDRRRRAPAVERSIEAVGATWPRSRKRYVAGAERTPPTPSFPPHKLVQGKVVRRLCGQGLLSNLPRAVGTNGRHLQNPPGRRDCAFRIKAWLDLAMRPGLARILRKKPYRPTASRSQDMSTPRLSAIIT